MPKSLYRDIFTLKQAYQVTYNHPLDQAILSDLSMQTKQMFNMALAGMRAHPSVPPSHPQTTQDVQTIYNAMRGAGTDELAVLGVLLNRNDAQIIAICEEYRRAHGKSLSSALQGDFSGHMRDGLLFIVNGAVDCGSAGPAAYGITRDAQMLEDAMRGAGTKDTALIRRCVRGHWNPQRWAAVKAHYQSHCHKSGLVHRVKGETSGDYERALVAVIG